MSEQSLAGGTTRVERGIQLWLTRRHEFERVKANTWRIPSCTSPERYLVWLEYGNCSCPDSKRAKEMGVRCKHVIAAKLASQHRRELREIDRGEVARS